MKKVGDYRASKLGSVVGEYDSWKPKISYNFLAVKAENSFSSDFGDNFCLYPTLSSNLLPQSRILVGPTLRGTCLRCPLPPSQLLTVEFYFLWKHGSPC